MQIKKLIASLACLLILAACNLPGPASGLNNPGPFAWIDAPPNGTTLGVNQAVLVVSHSSADAGLIQVEFSANGLAVSTDPVPAPGEKYALMKQKWIPSAPGEYDLRVRAETSDLVWSDYALVHVTVAGDETVKIPTFAPKSTATATPFVNATPTPVPTMVPTLTATATPRPSPTPGQILSTPTPTPALPVFGSPSLSGSQLYNIPGCGDPSSVTVTISIQNATAASLTYQVGGSGAYTLTMSNTAGSQWAATFVSDPYLSGYTGSLSYSIQATNGSTQVTSPTFDDLTVLNCKP